MVSLSGSFKVLRWNGPKALLNQRIVKIIPKEEIVDKNYLFYYISNKISEIQRKAYGIAVSNASMGTVRNMLISLPSLFEQKRIVGILEKADVLKKKRQEVDELSNGIVQSIFLKMFGDPIENTFGFPKIKFSEFSTVVRGSSPRPKGDPRYYGGTIPRLMVADLTRNGMYIIPRIDSLTEEGAKLSRAMKKGDVVMAVSGNPGLPGILNIDACIHDGFIGFRNLDEKVVSRIFVFHFLKYIKKRTNSQAVGAIFRNLNTQQVKNIDVPIPPKRKQQKFADIVQKVEKIKEKQKDSEKELDNIFNSLEQKMFLDR